MIAVGAVTVRNASDRDYRVFVLAYASNPIPGEGKPSWPPLLTPRSRTAIP